MRIFKVVMKVIAVFALACAVNYSMCLALVPYGTKSEVIFHDYHQMKDLDTVYVGTSMMGRACDPNVIDPILGTNSFNIATPSQYIEESFMGIKTATEEHDIKTVVYGYELGEVLDTNYTTPGRAYVLYKDQGNLGDYLFDAGVGFTYYPENYKGEGSINWMFPWIENHVHGAKMVLKNLKMRFDGTNVYDAAEAQEDWKYVGTPETPGRGYYSYDEEMDFNSGRTKVYSDLVGRGELNPDKMAMLKQMAIYCQERGVEFIVVGIPEPRMNILDMADQYFTQTEEVRKVVEDNGGTFVDFNLAKPELFKYEDSIFNDYQHFDTAGGDRFSKSYAAWYTMHEAGQNTDDLFYTPEEWLASVDTVELVELNYEISGDFITYTASVIAGPTVTPEYQFFTKDVNNKWVLAKDWSTDNTFTYTPGPDEKYANVRVNVRPQGTNVKFQRFRSQKVQMF